MTVSGGARVVPRLPDTLTVLIMLPQLFVAGQCAGLVSPLPETLTVLLLLCRCSPPLPKTLTVLLLLPRLFVAVQVYSPFT